MMKKPDWLIHHIEAFYKKDETHSHSEVVKKISLKQLQVIFNLPEDEPLIDCFKIDREHSEKIKEIENITFDFETYDYFISAYTIDWEAQKKAGGFMGLYAPPSNIAEMLEAEPVKPK